MKPEKTPVAVQTARAMERPFDRLVAVSGVFQAYETATLSAKVAGRVEFVEVDLGSRVKSGDVLARLETRDYELRIQQVVAQIAQVRAELGLPPEGTNDQVQLEETSLVRQAKSVREEARRNRDRLKTLSRDRIISDAELETVNTAFEVAQSRYEDALDQVRSRRALLQQRRAELEVARQQLKDTAILAPFDAVVSARRASPGEYLTPGSPLLTIVRIDPLRLRLEVPEREASAVRVGQPVRLRVAGETNAYSGMVSRLSPVITDETRMLQVEADVPNPGGLRPGGFVEAEILVSAGSKAVAVPQAALVTFAGLEKVFVVQGGKAVERRIMTGRREGDWLEVLDGVGPGSVVVVNAGNLQSGQPVTIAQ